MEEEKEAEEEVEIEGWGGVRIWDEVVLREGEKRVITFRRI